MGRVRLSLLELDILWEHLRLGTFPAVLEFDIPGATRAERADLRAEAWASLAERGLGWPTAPDERVADWLHRLARPTWELDARLHLSAGPRTSALLAWHHKWATAAVLDGAGVTLRPVPADRVASEAVALLPPHPAGTGNSITLPETVLDAAAGSGSPLRSLVSQGLGKSEARKITEVLSQVDHLGQFGAANTPAGGGRRRASYVVTVFDCPQGRYLFTRRRDWATLAPGTGAAIVRQLQELITGLSRQ